MDTEVEQFAQEKPAVSEKDLKEIKSNLINLKFITMLSNDNLPKHSYAHYFKKTKKMHNI